MNDTMIQEAVLDSIDVIEGSQLYAEYDVLMSLAETYMKSAMIQESCAGISFNGYNIVQEADENSESTYSAGELKESKGNGPAVPQFTQLNEVKDLKWYQRVWDFICRCARWVKKKFQKLCAKWRNGWAKFKTLTDTEANALRRCGCKIVAGERGENKYDVQFPFGIDLDALSNQLDELIDVFQTLSEIYQRATSGDGKLVGVGTYSNRLSKITAAIQKASKGSKTYYTSTEFFSKQEELANRLGKIEKPVNAIKSLYKGNAVTQEAASLAMKAAGVFNIMNKIVDESFNDALQLIQDCQNAAKTAVDTKEIGAEKKNAKKEQKAIANQGIEGWD